MSSHQPNSGTEQPQQQQQQQSGQQPAPAAPNRPIFKDYAAI